MAIEHKYGDILQSGATIICHQVNCQNVMGSGLAKQIKIQFPVVFNEYQKFCKLYQLPRNCLGKVQLVKINDKQFIANCFGQLNYGYGVKQTDYKALKKCFSDLIKYVNGRDVVYLEKSILFNPKTTTIAIPYKIGCGLAGGDWDIVKSIIEEVFKNFEGNVEIWQF